MNALLSKCNYKIRNKKRMITNDCIIRKRGKLLHVCLNSPGCRYQKQGTCIMCNYGQGQKVVVDTVKRLLPQIEAEAEGADSILIGTLGSIFDSLEVSEECLKMICYKLNQIPIRTIIFETHYTFINAQLCKWLHENLPGKDIVVEIGVESVDTYVQENCLNKKIHLELLKEKIRMLHSFDMSVTINVFLGAPFLTTKEQIEDTVNTIHWAVANDVNSVVVFPANIRKDTLLEYLYKHKRYERITQWHILEVLKKVPVDYLNRVYLSWYGDWIDIDENGMIENLPPYACESCKDHWMRFYSDFLYEEDNRNRKKIIEVFEKKNQSCDCYQKFKNEMNILERKERKTEPENVQEWLKGQFDV